MKPLRGYVEAIARPAFERHGFAWAELLRNWSLIVPELAGFCRPEKLVGPRGAKGRAPGGTLHLRVTPGRALELQHMQTELIDRVNAYFGYAAVERIAFLQAPLEFREEPARTPPRPDPALRAELEEEVRRVADPALRESLARLAEAVSAVQGRKKP